VFSLQVRVWPDKKAKRPIKILDLFCHTAGFGYGFMGSNKELTVLYKKHRLGLPNGFDSEDEDAEPDCRTLEEWAIRMNAVPLVHQPGAQFEYSLSIDMLGAVIEAVTGKSLGDFIKDHIFTPLGMEDSSFDLPEDKRDRLATCYTARKPFCFHEAAKSTDVDGRPQSGGGGLFSTTDDYIKFVECLTHGGVTQDGFRLLKPASFELMTRRDHLKEMGAQHAGMMQAYQGYGLGVGIVNDDQAKLDHLPARAARRGTFAWGGAAQSYFFSDPGSELSVCFATQLLNYSAGAPDLRPELARLAYNIFPDLRARQEASEAAAGGGGANAAVSGFVG